jgi:hypothetical protein
MSDTPDEVVTQRRHLHEAIQELPKLDSELDDSAYLTGWVLVAEFAAPDGSRWFCSRRGTDGGDKDLMPWTEKGYIRELEDSWTSRDVARRLDQLWGGDGSDDD